MPESFDAVGTFSEAASEAVETIAEESIKRELTKAGFSTVFVAATSEVAAVIAGHIAVPVLHTFLKVIDPTPQHLETILREPLQTGVQLARQAMSLTPRKDIDVRLQENLFVGALENLEKAHSYAVTRKNSEEAQKIRWTQALLAKHMGSDSTGIYFADLRNALDNEHRELRHNANNWSHTYDELIESLSDRANKDARECMPLLIASESELTKRPLSDDSIDLCLREHLRSKGYISKQSRQRIVHLCLAQLVILLAARRMKRIEAVLRFSRV